MSKIPKNCEKSKKIIKKNDGKKLAKSNKNGWKKINKK